MTAPTPHTVLVHARAMLVGHWTTKAPARTASGTPLIDPRLPTAASFSLLGAVKRAAAYEEVDLDSRTGVAVLRALRAAIGSQGRGGEGAQRELADWADAEGRTEQHVLAVLDRAIEDTTRTREGT